MPHNHHQSSKQMQSPRRHAFKSHRPVPSEPACSPRSAITATSQQTNSNAPNVPLLPLRLRLLHSPLLLTLAVALLLSAVPVAHACRTGSSSRNPYAYARASAASRGAGSPSPVPVHKMPPLAFGTVVCTPLYYITSNVQYSYFILFLVHLLLSVHY